MNKSEARKLIEIPLSELIAEADRVRRAGKRQSVELCGIINAKSGACSENCAFCAQSAHHSSDIPEHPLKSTKDILAACLEAKTNKAEHFGIVTSGNRPTNEELKVIADTVREIALTEGISPCASLGALNEESLQLLKDAGLKRYHHNIETSENFYPNVVSTHDYSERVNTVKAAKKVGFEVCSGGIIGLGESWDDRIDMAFLLKELDVDAVPLNVLVPIKGTPMENKKSISPFDVIRTIAIFRVILGDKNIKIAAGRETVLQDFGALAFMAGANGMLIGGYLTIAGRAVHDDLELADKVDELWKNG